MSGLYFDQHAIVFLAQLILTLVMTLYLLSLRNKTTATWWFFLYFAGMTAYAGVSVVEATSVWVRRFYAVHLQLIMLSLALVALLQFAYRYPQAPDQPPAQREVRTVFGGSILATLLASAWAVYQFSQLTPAGDPTTNTKATDIWIAVACLWVLLTFWRRAFRFSRRQAPDVFRSRHLVWPHGRLAQAAFAFILAIVIAVALISILTLSGWLLSVPMSVRALIPSSGVLLVLFFLGLAYFNYAPDNTSFMVKLIGISLVTLLLVIGSVGVIVAPAFETSFDVAALDVSPRTVRFEPAPDGEYRVSTLPLRFDADFGEPRAEGRYPLPFDFPFYGQERQNVTLRLDGKLVFGDWATQAVNYNLRPAITVLDLARGKPTTTYVKAAPETLLVSWVQESASDSRSPTVLQALLRADGRFEMRYKDIGVDEAGGAGILAGNGGHQFTPFDLTATYDHTQVAGDGTFTDYEVVWRQYLHTKMRPLVSLLLGASLLILLGFPLFFYLILIRPLNALIAGIQAVDAGDLSVRVPVRYQDEVGLITAAFNRMVASVQQASQFLEAQVAERTAALAESEARFRGLADSTFEAVLIHDAGRILDANQAVVELLGYTRDELMGMHIGDLLTPPSMELVARQLEAGTEEPYEVEGIAKDGTVIPLEVRGRVAPYQNRQVRVAAARDLTERKQIEAQQQRLAALEERERIGRELHDDLGQAMAYVSMEAQTVRAMLEQGQPSQAQAALTRLGQLARSAHGDTRAYILGIRTSEPPPVADFFDALQRYLDELRRHYGLSTQVSVPEEMRANANSSLSPDVETQLLRIIQEALTNVCKHAGVDTARLLFTYHADEVQVIIEDDGPGFDPQQTLQQGHFGLEITRERAESVGGSLEVRSSPGAGTRIVVRVARALPPPSSTEDDALRWRVLLVDDHPLFREGLRRMLTTRGVQVVGSASDGVEAQALARDLHPDLILMDVHMPRCDGLEATRRIKAELPEVKIVMLTVAAEDDVLFGALKGGASGYLLKNLEGAQFFSMLADVMRGETVLSPALAARVLTEFAQRDSDTSPEDEEPEPLTPRQHEVLEWIAQGLSNQEIAGELNITEATVKYHVSQILRRIQMRSRHELANYARRQGLVDARDEETRREE
ncbi:MAG: Response regulator protein VraR [Anaerolineales bacterium]|nr:Response regulator protein VraR [Anaerolineales bacterium]